VPGKGIDKIPPRGPAEQLVGRLFAYGRVGDAATQQAALRALTEVAQQAVAACESTG
jgi:hypothetical protein